MEINSSLKQKGWQQMQTILDKEMPVRHKKRLPAFWYALIFISIGFMSGFLFNQHVCKTTENDTQKIKGVATLPAAAAFHLGPKKAESSIIQLTETNHNTLHSTSENSNTAQQHSAVGRNNLNASFEEPGFRIKTPGTQTISDLTFHSKTNSTSYKTDNTLSNTQPVHFLYAEKIESKAIESLSGGSIIILKEPSKIQASLYIRNVNISIGNAFGSRINPVFSTSFQLGKKCKNTTFLANLGYRYLQTNIHEIVDTTGQVNFFNMDNTKPANWNLNPFHQIFAGVGVRQFVSESFYLESGIDVTANLNNPSSFEALYSIEREVQNPGSSGTNNISYATSDQDFTRRWNVYPYLLVGRKLSDKWNLQVEFRSSIHPANTVQLLNRKDVYFTMGSVGLQYNM